MKTCINIKYLLECKNRDFRYLFYNSHKTLKSAYKQMKEAEIESDVWNEGNKFRIIEQKTTIERKIIK